MRADEAKHPALDLDDNTTLPCPEDPASAKASAELRRSHHSSLRNKETGQDDIIQPIPSHISSPDAFPTAPELETKLNTAYQEFGDEIYDRFTKRRKNIITFVVSFCGALSPISSTAVLSAVPEVAAEYETTGDVVNLSNSGYMVLMALSPLFWGPISQVFGRRLTNLITAVAFFLLSIATALAPDLASFFVFRALSAFMGTAFILTGSACLGDIFRPVDRGTAIGWFMSGVLIGPALGPCIGGIIVTYSSWRSIFWLQTAFAGTGMCLVFLLVPETIHQKQITSLSHLSGKQKTGAVLRLINPWRVVALFRHWNLVIVGAASSALVWNMYSLLTPIRYILNPRFNLETPLLGGLFYLAPGFGYWTGSFMGGRWADRTVRLWIKKRNGRRVPEDRLRSAIPFVAIASPGALLIYGWAVEKKVGGVALPVIAMFTQGVSQLFCFPSLNTYCLDVMAGRGAEVAAGNFFVRYLAGCLGTAVVLPAVKAMGVGWFSTLTAGLMVAAAGGLMISVKYGPAWQDRAQAEQNWEASKPQVDEVTLEERGPEAGKRA